MRLDVRKPFISVLFSSVYVCACPQAPFFVDGYHGGIYGHYPVEWKTRFIADKLDEHPEWRICLEIEPETWDTVKVRTPGDYARFAAMAADKRIEFVNPTYAQPYCYNVSGESIIRQMEYGIRKIRSHFPDVELTTYSVEEPCFTSSLPQILKQFGFKYAVLKCPNTCWGGYMAPYGGQSVNWTGPDGSSIPTVPRYACEDLEKNSVWQTTAWANSSEYLDACARYGIEHPVGMCFQDAGWKGGPWIGSGGRVKNNSKYVTWREYFEETIAGNTDVDYRMSQEDVRVSLMWGSQVLQKIARQVRHTENKLIEAEKIGAIANISNGYRIDQRQMDEAWRTLMLAQHHDSWIVPYNRLNARGTWAQEIGRWTDASNDACNTAERGAMESFGTGDSGAGRGGFIRIYNTMGVARSETVSVVLPAGFGTAGVEVYNAAGKNIPAHTAMSGDTVRLTFTGEVPPFGYSTYSIVQSSGKGRFAERNWHTVDSGEFVMENGMYRITVDASKGGTIKSLVAKCEDGKEFADSGSRFALGELRGHFYDEGGFVSSADAPARVTVAADNPFEKSLLISGFIASHPFTQTITIREGDRKIDFDLEIDWRHNTGIGEFMQKDAYDNNRRAFYDDRFKLNVLFPADLQSPALYKDAPFDVCRSGFADTGFNTWDSIKHNIILHWVDLAEAGGGYGLALLSDHTTSYSYGDDFPLGLTVQYSDGGLWGRDYPVSGPTRMKFALIPHKGEWDSADIHNENLRWNEPLVCSFHSDIALQDKSLIDISGTGYEISAAYATGNGIVVRIFNADGDDSKRRIRFGFRAKSISKTDLNGNITGKRKIIGKPGGKCETEVRMPRFGLKTFLIEPERK